MKTSCPLRHRASRLTLGGCANKGAGTGAANDGDFVNGSALPERTEGVSFLSSNVDRNKFAPVYFSSTAIA